MGMFDSLLNRGQREREEEERRRQAVGLANEDQRLGYYTVSGGADMGQGFGKAIGSALGADMRSEGERATDKVRSVEAAAKGLDTSDPEYLAKLAKAFQEAGMVEEAQNAQKAYESQIIARQTRATAQSESERKARADERLDENRRAQTDINKQKLSMMGPKLVQYGNAFDAVVEHLASMDPTDPRYAQLTIRGDQLLQAMANESRGQLKYVNANDRIYVQTPNGETIKELVVGAKPGGSVAADKLKAKQETDLAEGTAKYKTAKQKLQSDYDAVVELYNHPGLKDMVGPVVGAMAHQEPEKSGTMGNIAAAKMRGKRGEQAYAVYRRVKGGAFINALAGLKASSTTGATGLGAVSEVEGSKVQSSVAALDPQQDVAAVRTQLQKYAKDLAELGAIMDGRATALGVPPVPLKEGAFTGPQRGGAVPGNAAAAAAPAAAPAAPAAAPAAPAADDTVRVAKNGELGRVKRSELEAAKADGWKEVE